MKKKDPVKATILKHLQAVYDKGFKDGQAAAIETMNKAEEHSGFVADEWYRENFGD